MEKIQQRDIAELKLKYVLTQDTRSVFGKIEADNTNNSQFNEATETYFETISQLIEAAISNEIEVDGYREEEIELKLRSRLLPILKSDAQTICICLDRFLLKEVEKDMSPEGRFFRFSMCRKMDGAKAPRQANLGFEEQLEVIKMKVPEIDQKKVVIVDDGLFSGGTVKEFISLLRSNGINSPIERIVGFIGNSSAENEMSQFTEVAESIPDLYEWIDIRDFSPVGGKTLASSKTNRLTTSVPYLFPWSDGGSASLDMSPQFLNLSKGMILAFKDLLRAYQTQDQPLKFKELVKAGYPLPTDVNKTIPISINDRVDDYLDRCIETIRKEQEREVIIFDMDGTLYQLDGVDNGFAGSKLERQVLLNARGFIKKIEGCNDAQADKFIQEGILDEIGLSAFLANRYGIDRRQYFDEVWNIDPEGIAESFQVSPEVIRELKAKRPNVKLVLLTSAPRSWAERLLRFIDVRDAFELIFTGEQYKTKKDVFNMLSQRYDSSKILSVGDQEATDIQPAKELGMRTLLVKSPIDIKGVLEN